MTPIRINNDPPRGRWAVYVGGGVLIRCRTKTDAYRLWGQNEPRNPYVVRRVLRWKRGKAWAGDTSCPDPRCQRPRGHGGFHAARLTVDGREAFDEWGDVPRYMRKEG